MNAHPVVLQGVVVGAGSLTSWTSAVLLLPGVIPPLLQPVSPFPSSSFFFFSFSLLGIAPVFNHVILCLKEKNQ